MVDRKFTDEELLELYRLGLSDENMAKRFKCNPRSVRMRRVKLSLVANFKNFAEKRNTNEELKQIFLDRNRIYPKSHYSKPEVKARIKAYQKAYYQRNKERILKLKKLKTYNTMKTNPNYVYSEDDEESEIDEDEDEYNN